MLQDFDTKDKDLVDPLPAANLKSWNLPWVEPNHYLALITLLRSLTPRWIQAFLLPDGNTSAESDCDRIVAALLVTANVHATLALLSGDQKRLELVIQVDMNNV